MKRLAIILYLLCLQTLQAQLNLSWETNQAMNGALFGYEFKFKTNMSIEPIVRFHQNRQYKFYDHREYHKRLHAFSPREFLGLGVRLNYNFNIQNLSPFFSVSFSTNYSRLGSKAQIFTQVGTYQDSFISAPIVKAEVLTFKPMNVFENSLTIRAKIPIGEIISLNYGAGITSVFYSQIDPKMYGNGLRTKLLFSPAADLGLTIHIISNKKAVK
jgi:hypothetical protein